MYNGWNAEMPTSGALQSGDSLFITPPRISMDPPWQVDPAPNRVPKCDIIENEICQIMGFVKIFWKNNVQDAYSPKISNLGQIVSEILAQLWCDDSIQILLNLAWFIRLGTR